MKGKKTTKSPAPYSRRKEMPGGSLTRKKRQSSTKKDLCESGIQQDTFVVHESVVTEEPSDWLASQLDRYYGNRDERQSSSDSDNI
jgi:hypothetical protein